MDLIFALLFFITLLLIPIVIVQPSLIFRGLNVSRKQAGMVMFAISVTLFIIAGVLSPQNAQPRKAVEGTKTPISSQPLTPTITKPTATPFPSLTKGVHATVVKVVDGDTLTVKLDGKNQTVRVIGIDTPETVDPRKPVQCFGIAASNRAEQLLTGKEVELESDPTQGNTDKYGRLLRFVWLDNGKTDYGLSTIAEGYAHEYTYATPYKYQKHYKAAQKEATTKKLGLWADTACTTPTPTSVKVTPMSHGEPTNTPVPALQQTSTSKTTNSDVNSGGTYTGSLSGDKDCKDFATHAEAQSYFVAKGGSTSNNVDNLDSDHDGIACESLP